MTAKLFLGVGALALCSLASPAFAQPDDEVALRDVIIVTAQRPVRPTNQDVRPERAPLEGPDVSLITARTPGAARIGNGPLSGQVQYRGLFGERLNLRVDGQRFGSGGA